MMQHNLSDSLRLVKPYLSSSIVTPQALRRIELRAQALPFGLRTAFEIRLAEADSQVDIAQIFTRDTDQREALRQYVQQQERTGNPLWPRLCAFCDQWAEPSSCLHPIPFVWLEYDLLQDDLRERRPAVFIALPDQTKVSASSRRVMETLSQLSGQGDSDSATMRDTLETCLNARPPNAAIFTLGVMLSRSISHVRLPVHALLQEQVTPYLRQIGWTGPLRRVEALVERYALLADWIAVDLDIGPHLHPHLGLELHLNAQPGREPRWSALFDELVQAQLCTPAKRDGLLSWSGLQTPASQAVLWPEKLLLQALLSPTSGFWALVRGLSHIKLFCRAEQTIIAKAYFGYCFQWVDNAR